jgi:hypothetical protein
MARPTDARWNLPLTVVFFCLLDAVYVRQLRDINTSANVAHVGRRAG